jgi:AcrR family transcriptional regulator
MTAPTTGRRERKKAATRRAIADAALALFLERGYHDVTVKQIADAADVAVATVFAYFPDGKQALVFDEDGDRETQLVATVLDRPAGQPILDALHDRFTGGCARRPPAPQMREFLQLVESTPELNDYVRKKLLRHEDALAQAIAEATGGDPDDIAITGLARFVLEAVALARNADDPRQALDTLFAHLKTGWSALGA